ncbi:galanin receptor 2a-like [Montipora capricornis]|uniref:galanin receptor 2a-like n=1 Tax=Montipora capricornis TaxID=246305 RepID=UPI0035F0FD4B
MTVNQSWPISLNNSFVNHTGENPSAVYIFTPAGFRAKLVLCFMFTSMTVTGILGNLLLLLYLRNDNLKKRENLRGRMYSSCFMKNLHLSLRNLALSDLFTSIFLPFTCIQVSFDVFQSGWTCKMVRYSAIVFVFTTINIMVVISLEKYLSTRKTPRTSSVSSVTKMMKVAWILGIIWAGLSSVTFEGQRKDINATHFTIICMYRKHFYPFPMMFIIISVQFVAPYLFITFANVSLVTAMWRRSHRTLACNSVNDALKAKLIALRIRGITLVVTIAITNLIINFFYISFLVYNQISQSSLDFQTDYTLRYASAAIGQLNSSTNVVIYFVQMKDFRKFLKKLFCPRDNNIQNREF